MDEASESTLSSVKPREFQRQKERSVRRQESQMNVTLRSLHLLCHKAAVQPVYAFDAPVMSYASPVDISQVSDPSFDKGSRVNVFALDIGGSLAKLVYKRVFRYRRSIPHQPHKSVDENKLPFDFYEYEEHEDEGQKLCFMKFETRNIEDCLEFIHLNIIRQSASSNRTINKIKVTGGGAHRYRELICSKLGIELDKEDEMECLIRGCIFLLRNIPDELFYYDKHATPAQIFVSSCLVSTFPFLLVNVGSGVSILKVESPTSYQRVGGSSIGGGTFWGLGTLLSGGKFTLTNFWNGGFR
ncbi:unnamed protein product [Heterobilharzia americana]|nr:unnamed protein product [Heterobilharzia americana]